MKYRVIVRYKANDKYSPDVTKDTIIDENCHGGNLFLLLSSHPFVSFISGNCEMNYKAVDISVYPIED